MHCFQLLGRVDFLEEVRVALRSAFIQRYRRRRHFLTTYLHTVGHLRLKLVLSLPLSLLSDVEQLKQHQIASSPGRSKFDYCLCFGSCQIARAFSFNFSHLAGSSRC